MQTAERTKIGLNIILLLNLLMAFVTIWVLLRMTPAIKDILQRNDRSLQASEEMLSFVGLYDVENVSFGKELEQQFRNSLLRAKNNITERQEKIVLDMISGNYVRTFNGDKDAKQMIISLIMELTRINRAASFKAEAKARQLGIAGAWVVTFFAIGIFTIGLIFKRKLQQNLITPFQEILRVISENKKGDLMRRCTGAHLSKETKKYYSEINELLDLAYSKLPKSNYFL